LRRVGLLLAGCGAQDGSDIHEVVLAALAIERAGAGAAYFAPEGRQRDVVDHATGFVEQSGAARDVLVESARLARGRVSAFNEVETSDLSALVVVGGFGAVKNLFDDVLVAERKARLRDVAAQTLRHLRDQRVPLGGIGLAHFVLEAVGEGWTVDPFTARPDRAVLDAGRRVGWTPGFLGAGRLADIARGLDELVGGLLAMGRSAANGPIRGERQGDR
jgi:enhancing lycopene biosynthesis protein 2